MSTFYPQNDYRGYLSHHGIKGQKWGEQNGPPYPLSTKIHNMVVKGKQKRAAKRREKILHDPAKLYKHQTEFTKDEIDAAVAKIKSANAAKELAPKKPKKVTMAEKRANRRSQKKVKKYSDIKKLEKYGDKLTTEEIGQALERIGKKQEIFKKKMNQLDQPRQAIELGSNYIKTAVDAVRNITNLKKQLHRERPDKLNFKEQHVQWMIKNGYFDLLSPNEIKAYKDATSISDNKTINKLNKIIDEQKETIKDYKDKWDKMSAYEREELLDEAAETYGTRTVSQAATESVSNVSDKVVDNFNSMIDNYEYRVSMGYEDPNRVYHSDSEIDWSIFSDVKMSDIDDMLL